MALQNPQAPPAQPARVLRNLLPHSFRWRVMALMALSLVLSIFGFGTYMAKEQADLVRQDAAQEAAVMAQNLAAISAHFMVTADLAGLESAASKFAAVRNIVSLSVIDARGKPVAELVNKSGQWSPNYSLEVVAVPQGGKPVLQSTLAPLLGGTDAAWSPIAAGALLGWARVSFAPPGFGELVYRIWIQALWVVALACVLALALLAAMLRPSLRALSEATRFANTLDQDLGQRLTPYADVAEFGALGNALNAASDRLYRSVAELKERQIALERATEGAQAANIAKSRFLATMSHEIRTPMNGVLGMAQMLLMPNLAEDERRDYARTILSSGQVLLALLNDILDLSKIESGKFELEASVFEPAAVLVETCALFSGAAQTKGLQLEQQWQGPLGQRYQCDAHRLRQMLSNLVGNAIKFTASGSVRIEVTEVEREGDSALLEFSVSDSGIGIAPDKQGLLFKPFSQADSSTTREFGGSGLGLSIVSRLASAMGGDVGVESEAGKGARFWFTVRVQAVAQGQDSRSTERAAPAKAEASDRAAQFSAHLLVAEDDMVNGRLIEVVLGALGVTMTLVKNGQLAVDAIVQGGGGKMPDLILMDVRMPVMNGREATQHIRQWEIDHAKPRIPIIALTAEAFEDDRRQCLVAGMDEVLIKPVLVDALRLVLSRWLKVEAPTHVQPPSVAPIKPVDVQAFVALVNELTPLLEKNKFAAIGRFKVLQTLMEGTDLAVEMDALAAQMQEMRFESVLVRLRHIADSLVDSATHATKE
jgi:signal transduction histidine kinase/DNA-binding response OmpR family regulator